MSSSCTMPAEFYLEILTRLPVKSVFRCKSVCKSWYSMISSPIFAKFHIQENKNKSSRNSLLLELEDDTHSMSYNSLESSLSTKEIEDDAVRVRMWYPFKSGMFRDIERIRLLGSCNGMVFLSIEDLDVYDDDGDSNSDDSSDESDDYSYFFFD
ncbi:F-box protein At5g49610-like [Papaver somniferum]|uniref:F-box protein At5g49610-like n=1 Tax=Papaver somniferum TaxID=3469 RepID=UPI000E6F6C3A|nr:F-box protein At5g49610-like [Papaver somniferum]